MSLLTELAVAYRPGFLVANLGLIQWQWSWREGQLSNILQNLLSPALSSLGEERGKCGRLTGSFKLGARGSASLPQLGIL